MLNRPQKITLAEMRSAGVRGLLIYCSDYHCSHWTAISGDEWPDDLRLSDLEPSLYLPGLRGRQGRSRRFDTKSSKSHSAPGPQRY
jgi:hypothetical protein